MTDTRDLEARLARIAAQADEALQASVAVLADARGSVSGAAIARLDSPAEHAVSVQPASANPKLAPQRSVEARSGRNRYEPIGPYCASTYVSIAATCPATCPFRDNGCFAQAGAQHLTMGRLDDAGRRTNPLAVTLAEATKIGSLWVRGVPLDGYQGNGRDLRLHVGGDVSCERGAKALATAVHRLRVRGLGAAWTYTHRWREIQRSAWGKIAVLASCETADDAELARSRGYAPALTVEAFESRRRFAVTRRISAIPCPFEAGASVTCVTCRLCFDDLRLRRRGLAIAFAAHGSQAGRARHRLRVLNGEK